MKQDVADKLEQEFNGGYFNGPVTDTKIYY